MASPRDDLVAIGKLKVEAPAPAELEGLLRSGTARLEDATNEALSLESRFDLAYNAAHAFSLAALRARGLRAEGRYIVFQALIHTVGLPVAQWRVLDDAHRRRNLAEYEGDVDLDAALVTAVIRVARDVATRVRSLLAGAG